MSGESTKSYLRVQYDLRPAKQVERRMFLDFFRRLAGCGIPIEELRYVGMGSIHFVDHILFHKFLGIDKLDSIEKDLDIEKRIIFNCPFDSIKINMMAADKYIEEKIDSDEKYIFWLDYDYKLSKSMIGDVVLATNILPVGSFIIVTVDAEPPKSKQGNRKILEYFKEQAEDKWDPRWKAKDFSPNKLEYRIIEILRRAFMDGISGRRSAEFHPCFSFVYDDSHKMVTVGGWIGRKGASEKTHLDQVQANGASYLVRDFSNKPYRIDIPVLTRRERSLLESAMPSKDFKKISRTGVSRVDFDKFSRIYRFFPSYGELLLG